MQAQPWKFYEKSVGLWAIESNRSVYQFPLQTENLDIEGVAREYFHYLDAAIASLDGFFTPTAIHYPPGRPVVESPMPLDMEEAKSKLLQVWKDDARGCKLWAPGAMLLGLTKVNVWDDGRLVDVELPDLFRIMFLAMPDTDRYTLALVTNSDIWLARTLDGRDNGDTARANSARLARAVEGLERAMDGKVIYWNTEHENVPVSERGFASQ